MAHLVVLSGPSGVGKSTVIKAALTKLPQTWLSVSATTRAPRPGEVDGRDYFFVSAAEFDRMVSAGDLLEWAEYAGNRYGTPAGPVRARLAENIPVLLEIEVQGAQQVRSTAPEAVLVFLAPPDRTELAQRLRGRGTETQEVVDRRLAIADQELAAAAHFDEIIVNSDVNQAAAELVSFLK